MKHMLIITLILALAGTSIAFDLGSRQPEKPPATGSYQNPDSGRQGGDTIASAVLLILPVVDLAGTTAGYNDDYDEVCPFPDSTAPDVVYTFTPDSDTGLDIDMLGSDLDTKIYVYDENLELVACNDDFWPDWTSFLENVPVLGGHQYFLVIDGYGDQAGSYLLNISFYDPCVLIWPAGTELEGEPQLVNDYDDFYNGGCDTEIVLTFQTITTTHTFRGVSGFYLTDGTTNSRDTDWFILQIPETGLLEIIFESESRTVMCEMGPQDCEQVDVIQTVTADCLEPASMVIGGVPGSEVWLWIAPEGFSSPDGSDVYEYDYILHLSSIVVTTESRSWTEVKGLFR